jgi:hypothetical protein
MLCVLDFGVIYEKRWHMVIIEALSLLRPCYALVVLATLVLVLVRDPPTHFEGKQGFDARCLVLDLALATPSLQRDWDVPTESGDIRQ